MAAADSLLLLAVAVALPPNDKCNVRQTDLIKIVTLAGVRQIVCRLPTLVHRLQQRQHLLSNIGLKTIDELEPLLADAVQDLHSVTHVSGAQAENKRQGWQQHLD